MPERRSRAERVVWAALAVLGAAVIAFAAIQAGSAQSDPTRAAPPRRDPPPAKPVSEVVTVSPRFTSQTVRPGFLGLSIEFQALRKYTGLNPNAVNPVFESLVRGLAAGAPPVIRIGGDSTDVTWLPTRGIAKPPGVAFNLTSSWLASTRTLASDLGAQLIVGLNLAGNDPALAAAEARAVLGRIGRDRVQALEIGNEPNLFNVIPWYHNAAGKPVTARGPGYGFSAFAGDFGRTSRALPPAPQAGPAYGIGPSSTKGPWISKLPGFLDAHPRLRIVTLHRYPLRNCSVGPSSQQYPTIAHLLARFSSQGLARGIAGDVAVAHRRGRQFRLDELNSVACRGKSGVSDTFASSLWALDALFNLARVGVDGVNFHTLPNAAYQLFSFSRVNGRWQAFVRPVYYGALMFAQAAPPGSRLLAVHSTAARRVSAWAALAPNHRLSVVLINKGLRAGRTVGVRAPAGTSGTPTLAWMRAPGIRSRRGITIGGQTFGHQTFTGSLVAPTKSPLPATGGEYRLKLPPASAAVLTFPQFATPSRSQQ
jgi:hypothetical protein